MIHDFENPSLTQKGNLPAHAYMIPFADQGTAFSGEREKSPYFHSLCGDWYFSYYKRYVDIPDGVAHAVPFDQKTIPVPSCWQMQGYGVSSKSDSSGDTRITSVFCVLIIATKFAKYNQNDGKIFICKYSVKKW